MNFKQHKNKLQIKNRLDFLQITQKQAVFRLTDRFIRKKKIQKYTTIILGPILLFSSPLIFGLLWDKGRFVGLLWAIYILFLFFLIVKYGMNRNYENVIKIKNGQIHYYVPNKTSPRVASSTHSQTCLAFQMVETVEVKRSSIVIHGYIVEQGRDGHVLKKIILPKEIENVDEFIRIAQSMVV